MSQQYGSLGQTVPFHDTFRYKEIVDRIQANIAQLNKSIVQLESLRAQIGTPSDSREKRDEIRKVEERTNRQISNMKDLFLQLSNYTIADRTLKLQAERLKQQFQAFMSRYTQILKSIMQRISGRMEGGQQSNRPRTEPPLINLEQVGEDDEQERQASTGNVVSQQQQLQGQAFNLALQLEQENQMAQLLRDTEDVQEIFQQMSSLVYCQGDMVNSIENNVDQVTADVTLATGQLNSAIRHRNRRRNTCICLGAVLALLLGLLILVIWLEFRH